MATVSPVFWTSKKNAEGLCPVYLRTGKLKRNVNSVAKLRLGRTQSGRNSWIDHSEGPMNPLHFLISHSEAGRNAIEWRAPASLVRPSASDSLRSILGEASVGSPEETILSATAKGEYAAKDGRISRLGIRMQR